MIAPLCLEWYIPIYIVLLGITTGAIYSLVNSYIKPYYDLHNIGLNIELYLYLLEHTIGCSEDNELLKAVLGIIGLSSIIFSLFYFKKYMTIWERITYITDNWELILFIGLAVMLTVFTINILLWMLGIGIIINTSSLT